MHTVQPDEVQISDRGHGNTRRVPVTGISASWEISGTGSFSCFAKLEDLRELGLGGSLQGMWLEWEHATAGRWGGVITGRPVTDGVAEIAADGWAALLRGRVALDMEHAWNGTGGGMMRRLVQIAATAEPTYIAIGTIDEGGMLVDMQLGEGDVADDLLPQVADATSVEWRVDADRVFTAIRKLGRDRSSSVRLVEDRHIAGYRIGDDLWASAPTEGFSRLSESALQLRETRATHAATLVTTDTVTAPLIQQWAATSSSDIGAGLIQRITDQIQGIANVHILSAPPAWVGRRAGIGANHPGIPDRPGVDPPTIPIELTLSDQDKNWATWDIGDTIRIATNSGFTGWFRPVVKALDVSANVMTASGEAMPDG